MHYLQSVKFKQCGARGDDNRHALAKRRNLSSRVRYRRVVQRRWGPVRQIKGSFLGHFGSAKSGTRSDGTCQSRALGPGSVVRRNSDAPTNMIHCPRPYQTHHVVHQLQQITPLLLQRLLPHYPRLDQLFHHLRRVQLFPHLEIEGNLRSQASTR